MTGRDDDLPFRIELWDDKDRYIEEVIALASDYATGYGAYNEAVKPQPGTRCSRPLRRTLIEIAAMASASPAALSAIGGVVVKARLWPNCPSRTLRLSES